MANTTGEAGLVEAILQLKNVEKRFDLDKGFFETLKIKGGKFTRETRSVHAVNNVSLEVKRGEALCVVGESGCGKSTVARLVAGLLDPSAGEIHYDNARIDNKSRRELIPLRKKMQMIFQNPYASLNPRMTIQQALEEPVRYHSPGMSRGDVQGKVAEVMQSVGVDPSWSSRYPHEFSGGQRQRISIARALTTNPKLLVCDEPVSALDVAIQAQILNLLAKLKADLGLSYLFISHDLGVVRHVCDDVAVMYLGKIVEMASVNTLFDAPQHPYTQALLSAAPSLARRKSRGYVRPLKISGDPPSPINPPAGCAFAERCPKAADVCRKTPPSLNFVGETQVACHFPRPEQPSEQIRCALVRK